MKKVSSPRIPDSKWVCFVFNWGVPSAVFTNAALALAFCKVVSKNWGNPFPEGALVVKRYRPAVDMYKFKEEDITEIILKRVYNG